MNWKKHKRGAVTTSVAVTIAGGMVALFGWTYSQLTTITATASSNLEATQQVDATQNIEIANLKSSSCVQNANMRNIAAAVHASFVSDNNCIN